ncbi:MAG: DEAD/DEAH box helicase [Bacteroidia bacterium]
MAYIMGYVTPTKLMEILNQAKVLYNDKIQWTSLKVKEATEDMEGEGFLYRNKLSPNQVSCEPFVSEALFNLYDNSIETKILIKAIKNALPNTQNYWSDTPISYEYTIRDLLFAIIADEISGFNIAYRKLISNYANLSKLRQPIDNLILRDFKAEQWKKVNESIGLIVLEMYIRNCLAESRAIRPEVITFLQQAQPVKLPNKSNIASILFSYYLMKGDLASAEKEAKLMQGEEGLLALGRLALLQNQISTAAAFYEETIKQWRKENNKKKGMSVSNLSLTYFWLLLKQNTPESTARFDAMLTYLEKEYSGFTIGLMATVNLLLKNEKTSAEIRLRMVKTAYLDKYTDTDIFIQFAMVCIWLGQGKVHLSATECYDRLKKAEDNGYPYYALHLYHILAHLEEDQEAILLERAKLISDDTGLCTLSDALTAKSDWEFALQSLLGVYASTAKTKTASDSRVAWLVNFANTMIQPIEQKYSKNGWTAGKNIALKRLKEGDVKNMSPQDIEAAKAIKIEKSSNYYGYGNTEYVLDIPKMIKALVGHPYLFLYEPTGVSCELVKEDLTLYVNKSTKGYELSFSHKIDTSDTFFLAKETNTRWKYLEINDHHRRLISTFGTKKIEIPMKGKEQLKTLISNLSTYIKVQSDADEHLENLEMVEADKRIYALLLPFGDGLKLELLVKPLGEHPPYFKAGKGKTNIVVGERGGKRVQTNRNFKEESKLLNEILNVCPTLLQNNDNSYEWHLIENDDCLNVLVELEPLKKENKVVIEWPKGEKMKIHKVADFGDLKLKIKRETDWFGVDGELKVGENEVIQLQQLLALMQGSSSDYIQLSDGKYLALTNEFRKRLQELAGVTESNKKGLRFHQFATGIVDDLTQKVLDLEADKAWKDQIKKIKTARKLKPEVPSTFEAELRPYQEEGFKWLTQLAHWGVGACLADDMGLGKTVQALAMLTDRADRGTALVVAPVSVCRNWVNEAKKFAPTLNVHIFGQGNRLEMLMETGKFDVIISSYGLLQQEAEMFEAKQFATIILDEAQAIKNRNTKRSQAVMNLKSDFKVITTGTPVENHLGELWNLFRFLNPGLLGSLEHFTEKFSLPIERDKDDNKRQALRRLIQPFVLRRRKNQVLKDLPEKTEIVLNIELSKEERAFYEALRRTALDNISNSEGEDTRFRILAELTKLRLACCNPKLVDAKLAIPSTKLEVLGDLISELIENGHKALIFSQFVKHLAIVKEYLDHKNIFYQYLDGSTPVKDRQKSIDEFQAGKGDVFLISLKAGGTGLNLTAADYVIHLDPWWNPAVEDQASDRAHRIGQQRPVTIYRLVTEETIEDKIVKLHEHKRDLADSLLSGTDVSGKLSTEELISLIKGGN